VNSREEFLAFCGVLGLGRPAAENRVKAPVLLRKYASDPVRFPHFPLCIHPSRMQKKIQSGHGSVHGDADGILKGRVQTDEGRMRMGIPRHGGRDS